MNANDPVEILSALAADPKFRAGIQHLLPTPAQAMVMQDETADDALLQEGHRRLLRAITPSPVLVDYLRRSGTRLLTATHAMMEDLAIATDQGMDWLRRSLRRVLQPQHLGSYSTAKKVTIRIVRHHGVIDIEDTAELLAAQPYASRIAIRFRVAGKQRYDQALLILGPQEQRGYGQMGFLRYVPGTGDEAGSYALNIPTPDLFAMDPGERARVPVELIDTIHLFPDPLEVAAEQ